MLKIKNLVKSSIVSFLALIALSLLVGGCLDNTDKDTWIIGTSADNPPYESVKDGELEGFDIDLMIAIGQHLGKKVEFRTMEFHALLAGLGTGNIDMAIAGMSVTKDRLARVDFSIPYSDTKIAVLFMKNQEYKELADLKGKVVGAQLGTIWSLIAHDIALLYPFRTVALASNLMLVEELKTGRIDALIMEQVQAEKFSAKNRDMTNLAVDKYSSSFAIALPKGSADKKNIDHTIKALGSNGVISSLAKKWGISSAQ